MIDSAMLSRLYGKKVKLIDNEGKEYLETVSFYESEYDSGSGKAEIGLSDSKLIFRTDEILTIEVIND